MRLETRRKRRQREAAEQPFADEWRALLSGRWSMWSWLSADEQRRLGDRFSLKGFHDTLLRNGSLPISFHRRLLVEAAATAAPGDRATTIDGPDRA